MNHPAVTHEHLLESHQCPLLQRLEEHGPPLVLFLHDTTDLDFSGHTALHPHLGQIGNGGGKGWLCHNSLAVDPHSRQIFGLAHQLLHVRPHVGKGEPVAAKRARADRESRLWLRAIDAIGPAPTDQRWVHVADRGADIFELLQALADRRQHYVIRSSHNRALVLRPGDDDGAPQLDAPGDGTPDPEPHLLHDRLRAVPGCASWAVHVGATSTRAARTASVHASYCRVELNPPHVRKGEYRREPVPVWAIRVWESAPPTGTEGLEWFLLTDQEVCDPGSLRRVVGWYECRPWIEEFHQGQKSGVGIEKLRLQDAHSLQAGIVLLSVVAVALVNLRVGTRDPERKDEPADRAVPGLWVRVLSAWRYQEERPLSVEQFTQALARLGGHLNRKADGPPGWITLWRGRERLHTMIDYETARAKCPEH